MRAALARARRRAQRGHRARARGAARGGGAWRSSSFHFYAMAIEAAARVDLGRDALGDARSRRPRSAPSRTCRAASTASRSASLCADALKRAGSPQAPQRPPARGRLRAGARCNTVRDARLRKLFAAPARPNAALFETTPLPALPHRRGRTPAHDRRADRSEAPSPHDDHRPPPSQRQAPRSR